MIHVNVRGLLLQSGTQELKLLIQKRKRQGEPEVFELPGGRINDYEKIGDCLRREVMEETGLEIVSIDQENSEIITGEDKKTNYFTMECIKPFAAYQTLRGPVDSFGIYCVGRARGQLLNQGDDTSEIHWADRRELQTLIQNQAFSEIDLPALLMFMKEYT